jgi:hypothetical protein
MEDGAEDVGTTVEVPWQLAFWNMSTCGELIPAQPTGGQEEGRKCAVCMLDHLCDTKREGMTGREQGGGGERKERERERENETV